MKKKRFNEAQILNVLKEYKSGVRRLVCRKYGIGESTIYAWHSKSAGMDVRAKTSLTIGI